MMMMIERRFGVVVVAGGVEWREEGVSESMASNLPREGKQEKGPKKSIKNACD